MASLFGSAPFLSHPLTNTHRFSSSSSSSQVSPPSNPPSPQSQSQAQSPPPSRPLASSNSTSSSTSPQPPSPATPKQQKTKVESTDWIASSLTRRFGIGAGLAWAGFLAFGVVSEQIKTRFEVSQQQASTRDVEKQEEVVLPNGISYYELRVGGGASPRTGDLVVIDLKGSVEGKVFVDTFEGEKKSLALVMGSRPYTKGMCEGIEYVLRSMKAGGKRRVIIPPSLGFGEEGTDLGSGVLIPHNATLEYVVEVDKVSIAPA